MIGTVDQLVVDCADPARLSHFWSEILGGEPIQRADDWHYVDPPGWTRIAFQRVPENKTTKNRLHIDVQVTDLKAAAASATTLGASTLGPEVTDAAGSFQVMHDPEGNEWCLVLQPDSGRPEPEHTCASGDVSTRLLPSEDA